MNAASKTACKVAPGFAMPLAIGFLAWLAGQKHPVIGAPVLAIALGLVTGQFFGQKKAWAAGMTFFSKKVLQASIVLLGAGMSLSLIARIGLDGLPVMLFTLALCLCAGLLLGRALKIERKTGLLVTCGTAICGASAIAAVSAVIDASGTAIAVSVTVIVIYNVLAALLFPAIGHLLGLSQEAFGLWAGTAVNDTSSVLAAASAYGAVASSYAVVVKLTRTLAIVPMVIYLGWREHAERPEGHSQAAPWYRFVPPFLILFIMAAAMRSAGLVPESWGVGIMLAAHFGITAAMAAVGMGSSLTALKEAGWRPVALGAVLWILVAIGSLGVQWVTGRI